MQPPDYRKAKQRSERLYDRKKDQNSVRMEDSITKISIRAKSMESSVVNSLLRAADIGSMFTNRKLPKDQKLKMLAHEHGTNFANHQQTHLLDCRAMQLKHPRRHALCGSHARLRPK